MALGLLALGTQLLGGGLQLFGAGKRRRAARAAEQQMRRNINTLDSYAKEGMPEAQYQQALQNIKQNQAAGLKYLQGAGGGSALRGISNLVRASNDAELSLDVNDALQRQRNRMYAWQQRQALDREKFLQESQAAQDLTGAGLQNMFGALSTAATADILTDGGFSSGLFGRGRRRTPLTMMPTGGLGVGASSIPTNVSVQPTF